MKLSLALEKTRGGIFQIKSKSDVALGSGIGTAFAVGDDGLLITAKHVVDGFSDRELILAYGLPPVNYKGVLKINGMFVGIPNAKVVAIDDANDIAVIKTPKPLSEYKFQFDERLPEVTPHSLKLDLDNPTEGESIAVSG